MTITNPSLALTYTGNNNTVTLTGADIVSRSITVEKQLLKDLEPSSNTISLTITRRCSEVEDIIACESDIKAVLKKNGTTMFTGYLSTDYNWTVTANGEQALDIKLEDVGTRLLEKEFISSGYHTFNCTVEAAVTAICTVAGITTASGIVYPVGNVIRGIEGAKTCKELLTSLLKEFNCVYYFNSQGELLIHEISCSSTSGIPEFDKTKLYSVGGTSVKLSKKIRQYKNARVNYTETGTTSNYLLYRNTTKDVSSSTSTCYLTLAAGQHFDGTEKYTPQAGVTRSPAYIEAVNAASEESLVGSREILAVTSATTDTSGTLGMSATVTVAGGKYLQIDAKNEGNTTGYFSKLDVKGSIIYVKTDNVILTADQQVATTQSNNILEEELSWVHTKALAQARANLLAQFHRYGGSTYTFYSSTSVALGCVVRLHEDAISGLDVNVMLIASKETDESDVIEYTAVGVSVFNLSAEVSESKTGEGSSAEVGQGAKGDDAQLFELILGSQTYKRDQRNTGNQAILVSTQISGYTGSLSVTTIPADLYTGGVLAIPYNNNYNTITVSATYGSAPTQTKVLNVIDVTSYDRFLGALSTEPTAQSVGFPILDGDYWVASDDFSSGATSYVSGTVYVRSNNSWGTLSFDGKNTTKFFNCLADLRRQNVSLSSLSNTDAIAWFSTIIADNLLANSIFANKITMANQSIIESSSWSNEPVPMQAIPSTTGFRINGSLGTIKSNRMEARDFHAFGDSIIDGDINNPRFKTIAAGSSSVSIPNLSSSNTMYNLQEFLCDVGRTCQEEGGSFGIVSHNGEFLGSEFDNISYSGNFGLGAKDLKISFVRNPHVTNRTLYITGERDSDYPSEITIYSDDIDTVVYFTHETKWLVNTESYYQYNLSSLYSTISTNQHIVVGTVTVNGQTYTASSVSDGYRIYMPNSSRLEITLSANTIIVNDGITNENTSNVSWTNLVGYSQSDKVLSTNIMPIKANCSIGQQNGTAAAGTQFTVWGAVFN